ncbi:MAG: hypothetical protein PUC65_10775 [Clostridiales bacterium]|nr:hypothetical protein [Clostridiales bacterium]
MVEEKEFTQGVKETDIWSVDKYISLHFGWPYNVAEHGGTSHYNKTPQQIYELAKRSFDRFQKLNGGVKKPMVMSELKADGDVNGQINQAKIVREFCELIKNDAEQWLTGFILYQFRDDGRLGLEMTDPNNPAVGIEQPLLKEYRDIIHEEFFSPVLTKGEELSFPVDLRWGGSEDAEGICVSFDMEQNPVFFEAIFDEDLMELNLMMCIHGMWFYKAPGIKTIDFMPAFWNQPLESAQSVDLKIFAPPASGENETTDYEDWMVNCYTKITKLPEFRIRFVPTEE